MKRIDFGKKKKTLHNEMLAAIAALIKKSGEAEIDLQPSEKSRYDAWVILSQDGCHSTYETEVTHVKRNDSDVLIKVKYSDSWISCEYAGDVVSDTLETVYDAVFDYVENLKRNGK